MVRMWAFRAVVAVALAGFAGAGGSATAAPIPPGSATYRVEAASGPKGAWFGVGTYASYNDALRAASGYKLKGYAVRMKDPFGRYIAVPGYESRLGFDERAPKRR